MKLVLAALMMFSALPASESSSDRSNRLAYQSQEGCINNAIAGIVKSMCQVL